MGRGIDEHLPRSGGRLQPCGDVHRVADHRVVHAALGTDVPGNHLAAGDADARLEPDARHGRDLEPRHRLLHLQRGAHRTLRVVRVHHRRAEEGEDAVAEQVGHRAALALDRVARHRQVAVQQVERVLGCLVGTDRGIAAQVGEERRHEASVPADRDREWVAQRLGRHARADVSAQEVAKPILERLRPQQRPQAGRELDLVEGLGEEVDGARLHRADGELHRRGSGHHHSDNPIVDPLCFFEYRDPILIRQ